MIRFFRAIAWLRWRILVNSVKGSHRRDLGEQLSRIAAVITPLIIGLMVLPACLSLAVGAFIGGWHMARTGASSQVTIVVARVLLAVVTLAVMLAPMVRSMHGAQVNLVRLRLMPIPTRALHLSELVGGLMDPWLLAMVPAILLLPVGLLAGGAWSAAALALLSGLTLLAVLATLGTLCSSVVSLLFRRRKRAELLTLGLLVSLTMIGFVVPLVEEYFFEGDVAVVIDDVAEGETVPAAPDFEKMFAWAAGFPSELYGKGLRLAAEGQGGAALARLLGLVVTGALLLSLSGRAYRKLLEDPAGGSSARAGGPARIRTPRLPGMSAAASAVALAHARGALRTVRGKLAVYFTFMFVVLMYLLLADNFGRLIPSELNLPVGPLLMLLGVGFTFLTLQPIILNQFAIDQAGLSLQFTSPISDHELVQGKIVGCGLLAAGSSLLCLLGAAIFARDGHLLYWLSTVLAGLASYLVLAPLCSLLSALLPKTADLNRLGKAGNPHPTAGFVGLLATMLCLAPAAGLYAAGLLLAKNPWLTVTFLAGWTVVAAAVSIPLVRLSVVVVARRRENLLLVATGR